MAKQIGIVTLYRGYNYGTSLQAYALKQFITSLGYNAHIIWTSQGVTCGRDIRLNKIARMVWRCLWHPTLIKHTFLSYKNSLSKIINPQIKVKFLSFAKKFLAVKGLSKEQLINFAASADTIALVCGSDQIWSATAANVEPLYFLRFAPEKKRIAYAPSFGASSVPDYNREILVRYISEIPFISVREESGAQIVRQLTERQVPVLLDPTLLLDWEEFTIKTDPKEDYILAYFLDEPSQIALDSLHYISQQHNCQVWAFPYKHPAYRTLSNVKQVTAGPEEFVKLIKYAKCVLTDSFHGTIFSINLQTPFWTFARNYVAGKGQSDRLTSILGRLNLQEHYITQPDEKIHQIPTDIVALQTAKKWIVVQRELSKKFLQNALSQIEGSHGR